MKCEVCGEETRINYGNANAIICSSCTSSEAATKLMEHPRNNGLNTQKTKNEDLGEAGTIDFNKLTSIMLGLGGIIVVGAVFWWLIFYSRVADEMNTSLDKMIGDVFSCLYSSSGACAFVSGIAQLGGVTPYEPMLFWIGAIILIIGVILKYTVRQ